MELRGTRCVLRPYAADDADALVTAADDPLVARWMSRRFPSPYRLADAREWIARNPPSDAPDHLAIEVAGELAGGIGLLPFAGEYGGTADFGYWLARRFWQRGVMTEAARLAAAYAFEQRGLRRLQAWIFAPNVASGRVLERTGFAREGVLRSLLVDRDGVPVDAVVFGRLASDPSPPAETPLR